MRLKDLHPAGIISAELARACKPHPAIFEKAMEVAGIAPEEVIHIGDSISSDVKGASALEICTLWLNRFGKEVPDGVKSISSLLKVLQSEGLSVI
jgi:FMN phosphatase YigB (HAD superfamily)